MTDDGPGDQFDTLETARDGHVGRITLSRPAAMNTFSTQLARDLDDAFRAFEDHPEARAIVVDGAGEAFSAGIDLSEHENFETQEEYETWVGRMEEPFLTLTEMATPVIAAAHGHAAANGLGLLAACDLAVATEGTQFGATAPKVGLFCMGPAVPLMASLPRKRYLELLLTGDLVDAETAYDWGLLNRVTPAGEHVDAALDLARTIASKSPTAIGMGKRTVYEMMDMDYASALAHSNAAFADLCGSADAEAGIAAFLDGEALAADEWPGN